MPPTTSTTPAPIDEATFTPGQDADFAAAAKLGGGVPTYNSANPVMDGPNLPAKEPTVLTSGNITDKVIPDLTQRAGNLATKGTYVGQDGNAYYADNSVVSAPVDAEFQNGQWVSNGKTYGAAPQYIDNSDNDPGIAKTNEIIASLKSNLDSTTLGSINAIQQQHDILVQNQQEANAREDKAGARTAELTGGRYTPLNTAGIALARTSFGLQQIAKLDADENAAIAQVRKAQQDGDFQLMDKALGTAETIRQEKQKTAADLAKTLSDANAAAAKANAAAVQSDQIAQVLASGVTDPAQVFDALRKAGVVTTAEEVKSGIDALKPTSTSGDTYKFTNEDMGKLLASGLNAKEIQAVQDAYNGGDKTILSKLSSAEKVAVQKALGGTQTPAANTFKLTSTQKSQLLSGGFVLADVAAIETDVAKYGIDKVTEGMPADQAALVKRVLAGTNNLGTDGDTQALIDALNS